MGGLFFRVHLPRSEARCLPRVPSMVGEVPGAGGRGRVRPGGLVGGADALAGVFITQGIYSMAMSGAPALHQQHITRCWV